jgi:two-component system, LytTR family, response regulator
MNTQRIASSKQHAYPLSLIYTRLPQRSTRKKVLERTSPEKIALPTFEGLIFEDIRNIIYLEAEGNYTYIHLVGKKKFLVCKTLREVEEGIRTDSFVRVHRSYTINMLLLSKYIKGKGGYVIMEDGSMVNVSAGRKKAFMEAVEALF